LVKFANYFVSFRLKEEKMRKRQGKEKEKMGKREGKDEEERGKR
jgi:hypothetical protein